MHDIFSTVEYVGVYSQLKKKMFEWATSQHMGCSRHYYALLLTNKAMEDIIC